MKFPSGKGEREGWCGLFLVLAVCDQSSLILNHSWFKVQRLMEKVGWHLASEGYVNEEGVQCGLRVSQPCSSQMKRRTNQRLNRIGMHNLVITVTWYGPLAPWGLSNWQCCLLNIPSTAFCTRLRFYKLRNRAARPCSASEYCQHQGLTWSLWLLLCALLLLLQPLMEQQVRRVEVPPYRW